LVAALSTVRRLVRSMPGIGPVVAAGVVAMLPELGHGPTAKTAAIVGAAPFDDGSGARAGPRHSAGGRMTLRTLLYMASLSACRHIPVMRAFSTSAWSPAASRPKSPWPPSCTR